MLQFGKRLLIFLPLVLLVACAAPRPQIMEYYPESEAREPRQWPELPEVPRYKYGGQLVGEYNFRDANPERVGRMEKLLRWVVGLGQRKSEPLLLQRPQAGTALNGRIYVTDMARKAVFVFDELQGKLEIWDRIDKYGSFASPVGICVGPNNEILVSDSELARIVRFDLQGNPLGDFGSGQISRPTGLACDPATGRIYVADSAAHNIKVLNSEGALVQIIGQRGTGPGEFNGPTHLAFAQGKLYVSDTLNARVQVFNAQGEFQLDFGKRGLFVGNLVRPKGIGVDDEGNVYVVEGYYDHLLIYNAQGELLLPIGGTGAGVGQFFLPTGVWVNRDRIFVADMFNGRVMVFEFLGV